MTNQLKILLISPEVTPYAKTGGLADVAGALPKALSALGCDVRVMMPLYGSIRRSDLALKLVKRGVTHRFLKKIKPFNVWVHEKDGVQTYFIEHDQYFKRDELYGTADGDYPDNALRFSFFSQAACTAVKALGFCPDIMHLNDWQTALIPFYLKNSLAKDRFYGSMRTLFTIHNLAYQGVFMPDVMEDIDIPGRFFNMHNLEFYGKLNFMKSGILYSDSVSTVSQGYAREILTKEYGCGLEGVLGTRKDSIFGITNGADYSEWNPESDPFIKAQYTARTLDKKHICKKDLLEHVGLSLGADRPLLGVVTRLAWQKGIDLLVNIMDRLVGQDIGVVILGKGEEKYHNLLNDLASKNPQHVSVSLRFDNELAHKIEAGVDLFLMPSRYEPCGLNQMYSLKYGTIPVVRCTGGLDDVITDIDTDRTSGNGFKFENAEEGAFFDALQRALKWYSDRDEWTRIMARVMQDDFSWGHAAQSYMSLYSEVIQTARA